MKFTSYRAIYFSTVILIITLLCCSFMNDKLNETQQKATKNFKRYNIESGIIEYELSGFTKGKQTIYFDNWGMREATYSINETKITGITSKTNTLVITDGEWVYNIDLDAKTGTKSKNIKYEDILKYSKDKKIKDISEQTMKDMGGEKIGKEELLGKMCDIWEIKKIKTKIWIWKGITLKSATNMAGMNMDMVATKFAESLKIPSDKFKKPSDVKITDIPVMKEEDDKK